MSYCRWSSDDFRSDVYVYESVGDFFAIHVAGNHLQSTEPRPPPLDPPNWWERGERGIAEFTDRQALMHKWLDAATHVPIGLAHDGETFQEPDAGACADRLEYLRGLGYQVPQHAIDALRAEAAEPEPGASNG